MLLTIKLIPELFILSINLILDTQVKSEN